MGGAAGHMAHPFDCREVRNGQDLINFYVKAVNAIPLYAEESKGSSVSVKLDGVNASFRLQKANNSAGFTFVLDRGGKTPGEFTKYDFEGVTPDNVLARVKGNEGHGLIQVVNHMTKLLNHDLMDLKPHVEALGIFERMGPDGVFFDAEYYANADDPEGPNAQRGYQPIKNNVNYNQNYIAIHRLSEFYTETKETKTGKIKSTRLSRGFYWETVAEINDLLKKKDELLAQRQDTAGIDQLIAEKNNELKIKKQEHQQILDNLAKAVQKHSEDLDMGFNVYTKIGLRFKEGLTREMVLRNIEKALEMKVPYNYLKINENKSIGPTAINEQTGEVEGRKLKDLLLSIDQNPAHVAYYPDTPGFTKDGESVKGRIQTKPEYKKDPKQSAFALQIYEDVMVTGHETGIGPFDIGNSPRDAEAINSAVIFWHAVRYIGNAIKNSIVTDVDMGVEGGDEAHEGIVIQSTDICDGIAFKFTGEFIVDNRAAGFGVTPKGKDIPSDSSEAMNETKFKYGELLESFMVEAEPVIEQKTQLVVLIPGGFKPPTNGHFSMIKQYEERSDVSKVIVVTGFKPRKEPGLTVTHEQSKAIFDIYGGFGDKVEFRDQGSWPTPMRTCYEYINDENFVSEFPGVLFALGASDKGGDKERIAAFYNYFQNKPPTSGARVVDYPPAAALEVDGKASSATRMRKAFTAGDWETFKKLMPHESFYDDVVQVLVGGQAADVSFEEEEEQVNENFFSTDSLFSLVDEVLLESACTRGEERKYTEQKDLKQNEYNDILTEKEVDALDTMLARFIKQKVGSEFNIDELTDEIVGKLMVQWKAISSGEEQLEEISAMGGVGGGAVEGFAGGRDDDKRRKNAGI